MARLFFALFQSCGLRRDLIDDGGASLVLFLRRPFVFTTGGDKTAASVRRPFVFATRGRVSLCGLPISIRGRRGGGSDVACGAPPAAACCTFSRL